MLNKSNIETNPNTSSAYKNEIVSGAWERNPDALVKAQELLSLLNSENFDEVRFESLVKEWNDKVESSTGFKGAQTNINDDRIRLKHGRLIVDYFTSSDSIRFRSILKGRKEN